jgi:type III secretion system FlhB-like substrate exporter
LSKIKNSFEIPGEYYKGLVEIFTFNMSVEGPGQIATGPGKNVIISKEIPC